MRTRIAQNHVFDKRKEIKQKLDLGGGAGGNIGQCRPHQCRSAGLRDDVMTVLVTGDMFSHPTDKDKIKCKYLFAWLLFWSIEMTIASQGLQSATESHSCRYLHKLSIAEFTFMWKKCQKCSCGRKDFIQSTKKKEMKGCASTSSATDIGLSYKR